MYVSMKKVYAACSLTATYALSLYNALVADMGSWFLDE